MLRHPTYEVTVSPDQQIAYLTIKQDPQTPYQATVDAVYDALAEAQVEFGVMLEKIDRIIANQEYPDEEIIALGQEVVPGVDGRLEYLFSQEGGGSPKDKGHSVDHFDLSLVENVTAGQVLVRKVPAQPGKPGMTVRGRPIPAPKVRDVRLPVGRGTQISEENPLELVAKADGFVRLDAKSFNRVVVEQVFNVNGDVDLSTGNLDIEGSVHIRGNVREGFKVKATGNITVHGVTEAGHLTAGGKIETIGGIVGGQQRATAVAGEDMVARFADNADITAGGSISIADEAVNCNLQADKAVILGGRGRSTGAIIGGQTTAGQEIKAVSVGTEAETLTRLRAGEHPALLARRQNMQVDLKQHQLNLDQLEAGLESLAEKQASREANRQDRAVKRAELEKTQSELHQHLKGMFTRLKEAGVVTPADAVAGLQTEIKETGDTLKRVESSISTLLNQDRSTPDRSLSPENCRCWPN